jgi:pimeloyl-ACP methyl ester carboxylesterase
MRRRKPTRLSWLSCISGSGSRLHRRIEPLAPSGIPVVFVHGLWLNGLESHFLRERVKNAGFAPSTFRYPSLHTSLAEVRQQLAARLRSFSGTVHVVGHSLGGLIVLETLTKESALPPGRVVLLGSPVQGSRAATAVGAWSIGPQLLGQLALAELARPRNCRWEGSRELGVIAGTRSVGLGRLFASLPAPNDGTVALDETRIAGAKEHVAFEVSHIGMLLSAEVAAAVIGFMRAGRFGHAAQSPV